MRPTKLVAATATAVAAIGLLGNGTYATFTTRADVSVGISTGQTAGTISSVTAGANNSFGCAVTNGNDSACATIGQFPRSVTVAITTDLTGFTLAYDVKVTDTGTLPETVVLEVSGPDSGSQLAGATTVSVDGGALGGSLDTNETNFTESVPAITLNPGDTHDFAIVLTASGVDNSAPQSVTPTFSTVTTEIPTANKVPA